MNLCGSNYEGASSSYLASRLLSFNIQSSWLRPGMRFPRVLLLSLVRDSRDSHGCCSTSGVDYSTLPWSCRSTFLVTEHVSMSWDLKRYREVVSWTEMGKGGM